MASEFYTGIDVKNQRVQNVGSPSSSTDAPNKQYVDDLVNGVSYKNEVRAATTAATTLATGFAAGQVIDGITLATGDRVLNKDAATQSENGIYIVPASGAPTRATDADTTGKLNNATVYVTSGTVNAGREYTQTTQNPTVGTSNIVFAQKSTGATYTATAPVSVSGTVISLTGVGVGLIGDATSLRIDTSVVVRKYSTTNSAGTSTTVTHNLGTNAVDVTLIRISDGAIINADVVVTDTNTVTVNFGTSQSAGAIRIVVMG